MTREEFLSLPSSLALGLAWDHGLGKALSGVEAPRKPASPKFDQRIYRRDGFQWASETDLEGLRYWAGKYGESALGGGQYADKDAKKARQMGFWIAWRECFPEARWSGKRGDEHAIADLPSAKPAIVTREARADEEAPATTAAPAFDDSNGGDDSEIPF